ncbi:uncharacterized protein ACNLHF_003920 [Anomaloglossus baeobatrachus]
MGTKNLELKIFNLAEKETSLFWTEINQHGGTGLGHTTFPDPGSHYTRSGRNPKRQLRKSTLTRQRLLRPAQDVSQAINLQLQDSAEIPDNDYDTDNDSPLEGSSTQHFNNEGAVETITNTSRTAGQPRTQPGIGENTFSCPISSVTTPVISPVGAVGGTVPGNVGWDLNSVVQQLVSGVKEALSQSSLPITSSPIAAWCGNGRRTSEVVSQSCADPETQEDAVISQGVPLSDAAKGELYVCFEGPLGIHLKQEVREKIWADEYVEIFSLLPLEKYNLDRVRFDERKREEQERRYRLIPQTFANWFQAFAILASVIGQKTPEHCSALFCYMNSIGEAHRVYGGLAWLRYDEQFRQRKAGRQGIRWDHKDIGLWMRLMTAPRGVNQPFQGYVGRSSAIGLSAANRKEAQ